jgi:hypothetical protein
MRWVAVLILFGAACGSNPMIIGADGGDMSVTDGSSASDMACLPGVPTAMVACGGSNCAASQACCFSGGGSGGCSSCCASGTVAIQCTQPGDCGSKPCCLELAASQPTIAYCVATQDACPSSLSVGSLAGLTGHTRMCNTDVDCTTGAVDSPFKTCCTSHFFGATQKICFNNAQTVSGITCP